MSLTQLSKLTLVLIAALSVALVGCKEDEDEVPQVTPTYEVLSEADNGTNKPVVQVNGTLEGVGATNRTWSADTVYLLNGAIFVQEGQTLNIEEGTLVKALPTPTNGDAISALIVARGAQIFAEGTATNPIIFTTKNDDITNPNDLAGAAARGQWGGVVILGSASTNTAANSTGQNTIEGIEITEKRALYGGSNDADNSGVFRYVSIRHGGQDIGAGNEINGLTMGGVGSGTTIEYVEVAYNQDDGFEFFGGTVNTKYLVAAYCGDDAFDYDQGWRGNNQFWFAIQGQGTTGNGGEHDGGTDPEDGTPYSIPTIYNATYVSDVSLNTVLMNMRDNSGGKYWNSVFTGFEDALLIEDLESGEDAYARFEAGDIAFKNNVWHQINNDTVAQVYDADDNILAAGTAAVTDYLMDNGNTISAAAVIADYQALGTSFDPRPTGDATTGAATPGNAFFTATTYRGAFAPTGDTWIKGWTMTSDRLTGN